MRCRLTWKGKFVNPTRPTGFFLTLLRLTSAPYFLVAGIIALVLGGLLMCQTQLSWGPTMAHFLISVGVLFCSLRFLNGAVLGEVSSRRVLLLICLGFLVFFIGHQRHRDAVRGTVIVGGKSVETVDVNYGGTMVERHLGAPLNFRGTTSDTLSAGTMQSVTPAQPVLEFKKPRMSLSRWFLEPLGPQYQSGGLNASFRAQTRDGAMSTFSMGVGKTYNLNEALTLRLAALEAVPGDDGHRLLVEVIGVDGTQRKMLYDKAPNLEMQIEAAYPRLAVVGLEHEPAQAFYIYERRSHDPLTAGLWLLMITLAIVFAKRRTAS